MIEYENLRGLNESFFADYKKVFNETLESGWFILGEKVRAFEAEYGEFCTTNYCIGVANGLDALTIALKTFEFDEGSEIIVPSNTYIATILAILNSGLTPVLVEPNINTYNIDPDKIEKHITKKTKAIMVVHLYGKVCKMDSIIELKEKYQLKLIEDCAQAHGAKFKGQSAGSFGDFGAHSFYPTKNLGALADAGALTTNNQLLADKAFSLRNYGSKVKYHNDDIGFNSRLDEIQAAFLSVKLKKLNLITEHKRMLARIYTQELSPDFIKPVVDEDNFDVYHIYNIRHPERDALKEYLINNGIKTEIHYPIAPHRQKALSNIFKNESYPISEEIHRTTLSLPISYIHSESDVQHVISVLNKY